MYSSLQLLNEKLLRSWDQLLVHFPIQFTISSGIKAKEIDNGQKKGGEKKKMIMSIHIVCIFPINNVYMGQVAIIVSIL